MTDRKDIAVFHGFHGDLEILPRLRLLPLDDTDDDQISFLECFTKFIVPKDFQILMLFPMAACNFAEIEQEMPGILCSGMEVHLRQEVQRMLRIEPTTE